MTGMEILDIGVGVASTVLSAGTIGFLVLWRRVAKTPKRLDRLDAVVPVILRGVWALLKVHVDERNGDTDPQVANAYEEITKVITDGAVSKKDK